MTIEFSSFFGNINGGITSLPIVGSILSSVVYTSIILSIILIIVITCILPFKQGTPSALIMKAFIYTFILNAVVFTLHSSTVANRYKEKYTDANDDVFINNINRKGGGIYDDDNVKVIPNFKKDNRTAQEIERDNELDNARLRAKTHNANTNNQTSTYTDNQIVAFDLLDTIENRA
jgi:hypothetical protein